MKEIDFRDINIEGFRSFVTNDEFNYLRPGINLVKGKNGSGKSTLIEGLFWVLYGDTLKGTTKTKIPSKKEYRPKGFRGTRVTLLLYVNGSAYFIARHIKFKGETLGYKGDDKLMVFEDKEGEWELRSDELYNNDSQEFLNTLIGIDSNTFLNSVVFGQKMKRLVEATPSEKRDIFEKVFDLDFIAGAKAKAKEKKTIAENKLSEYKTKLHRAEHHAETAVDKLAEDKEELASFEEQRTTKLTTLNEKLNGLLTTLKDSETKTTELETSKTKLQKTFDTLDNNDDIVLSKQGAIDTVAEELQRFKNNLRDRTNDKGAANTNVNESIKEIAIIQEKIVRLKNDLLNVETNCPTCSADLKPEKVQSAKKNIQSSINKEQEIIVTLEKNIDTIKSSTLPDLQIKIDDLSERVESTNKSLLKEQEELQAIKDAGSDKYKLQNQINELGYQIKNELNSQDNTNSNISDTRDDIEEWETKQLTGIDLEAAEKEIKEYSGIIDECNGKIVFLETVLDKINWWVSKGFGSSGIKSYVFFAMLNNLNKSILKYCDRLGVVVQFSVDMEKASKPFLTKCFTSEGVEMDYNELSGGEQARINIATAFAFYDIIADSKTKFNCIFLDETFAGLDEDGLYQAFDLVRSICDQGKSIYVITHKTDIDMRNTKTIDIFKENHISRIS